MKSLKPSIRKSLQTSNQLLDKIFSVSPRHLSQQSNIPEFNIKRPRPELDSIRESRRRSELEFIMRKVSRKTERKGTKKRTKLLSSENFESIVKKCNEFKRETKNKKITKLAQENTINVKKIRKSIRISEIPDFWFGSEFDHPEMVKDAKQLGHELTLEMSDIHQNKKWRQSSRDTIRRAEQVIEELDHNLLSDNKPDVKPL